MQFSKTEISNKGFQMVEIQLLNYWMKYGIFSREAQEVLGISYKILKYS